MLPENTNVLPVEIAPFGFDGIGISGQYVPEALSRMLGYWSSVQAYRSAKATVASLISENSNYSESLKVMSETYAIQLKLREIEKTQNLLEQRRIKLKWAIYGAGIGLLSGIGGIIGANQSGISGAAIGASIGLLSAAAIVASLEIVIKI